MYHIINIPVEKLLKDSQTFRISISGPSGRLVESVKAVGILNPLWVRKTDRDSEEYEILLGYRRLEAAVSAGLKSLPCRVLDKSMEDRDILLANLYDNLSHRALSPAECAMALKKIRKYYPGEKVLRDFMPVLGLRSSEEMLGKYIEVLELPREVIMKLDEGSMPVSNAFPLLRMSPEEQLAVLSVIDELRLGVNLQKEFIENLFECSRRDDISISEVLDKPAFRSILEDQKTASHIRASEFRAALRRLRYPRLSEVEARFDSLIRDMTLPPEIKIRPPRYFEGSDYDLTIKFRTPEDLAPALEKVQESISSPEITNAFRELRL